MKPTKTEISKIFSQLRKYGYTVINMTNNGSLRKGMTGFVDIIVFSEKKIYFIEIKLTETKDKFSTSQQETARKLISLSNSNKDLHYVIICNIIEAQFTFDCILQGEML